MPRVHQKKKSRAGKTYTCGVCRNPIEPGESYYEWSFRYAGTHRQHTAHGMPRQSQLTSSKMSEVYAAVEMLEDWTWVPTAALPEDASQDELDAAIEELASDAEGVLEDARSQAQDVADEYADAIDAMPASEEQNQERIDAIEDWVNEVESAIDNIRGITVLLDDHDGDVDAALEAAEEEARNYMSDAAGAFSY